MRSLSWKRIWPLGLSLLLLIGLIVSFLPAQVRYHKWRLETAKTRKARLLANNPSLFDRFRLGVGYPVTGNELDAAIHDHEAALVSLGFLVREQIPAEMFSCPQTMQTLNDLGAKCPWYRAERVAATNLLITTCSGMLDRWHKRAKELGW